MRENGLKARQPRRFRRTTDSGHAFPIAPNHLDQDFTAAGPDRKWGSDISYIWTREGWLYLAAVTDAHSRRILGWAMDSRMGTFLVAKALKMAHTLRGEVPEGVVFHADWGTEFTSDDMFTVCRDLEILQSVGRTGVWLKTMRWPRACGRR